MIFKFLWTCPEAEKHPLIYTSAFSLGKWEKMKVYWELNLTEKWQKPRYADKNNFWISLIFVHLHESVSVKYATSSRKWKKNGKSATALTSYFLFPKRPKCRLAFPLNRRSKDKIQPIKTTKVNFHIWSDRVISKRTLELRQIQDHIKNQMNLILC